ncbi:hypothetical protein [Qipengyuania nanhaisediminis]|uniref:hypothetical protein n=1 Tax=Qipengyuania nanhaisediminis TaxID=604088 RepID=UPI0038B36D27
MIDYLSLSIGHALLAFALIRLVMRDDLDSDPVIGASEKARREAFEAAQAKRRASQRASEPAAPVDAAETAGR